MGQDRASSCSGPPLVMEAVGHLHDRWGGGGGAGRVTYLPGH